MRVNNSPLRYPGGKSRLIDFFISVIDQNDLKGGTYIEPFSGGAAVALYLAIEGYMNRVVINDYDRSIYAFWYSILNDTDSFIDKIYNTEITINEWKKQKDIQLNKYNVPIFDLGFSTFFLNRTNRSGVLKAGVIGGQNQLGTYKIDARYNKEQLIHRIKLIVKYKDNIILHNDNAIDLLRRYKNISNKNLIYLDPPYFVRGRELYVNFFKEDDHIALSEYIQKRNNMNWIVTYDNHDFIRNLYPDAQTLKYILTYSAGNTKQGTELLFYNENLNIPRNILSIIE